MPPPVRAFAPRPIRAQQAPYRYPGTPQIQSNAATAIGRAQRDFARRTPGEAGGIGASQGGTGLTPSQEWANRFPGSPTADAVRASKLPTTGQVHGPAITGQPLATSAAPRGATPVPAGSLANAPTNLNSPVIQAALDRTATPTGKITPNAQGGNNLTSQFGTGSSRAAQPGEMMMENGKLVPKTPVATETANGISRASTVPAWQAQVMQSHPEIAQAGSEGNLAYTKAHQAATAAGKPFDPVQLAHDTMNPIYAQRQAGVDEENTIVPTNDKGQNDVQIAADKSAQKTQTAKDAASPYLPGTPLRAAADAKSAVGDWLGNLPQRSANALASGDAALGFKPQDSTIPPSPPVSGLATVQPGQGKLAASAMGLGTPNAQSSVPSSFARTDGPPAPVPDNSARVEQEARQSAFESQMHNPPPQPSTGVAQDNSAPRSNKPNLARGLMPGKRPSFKFPAGNAMAREQSAINRGTGGAKPGDKPMPINLPSGPAVANTGEDIMPTPAGPAVLNRNMQRKMKPKRPLYQFPK